MSKSTIDAGILAGGLASRMQGKDKGLQAFQSQSMCQWVFNTLQPFCNQVIINCNRNLDAYKQISPNIIADVIPNYPGPLAGLLSLLSASKADYLLVSPCDTPLLNASFPKKMLIHLEKHEKLNPDIPFLAAVKAGERQHPLHLCISREYRGSLEAFLNEGKHRVMEWMQHNQAQWVDFSEDAKQFKNFNTLEEVSAY